MENVLEEKDRAKKEIYLKIWRRSTAEPPTEMVAGQK